jgi:hypothetical protein
MKKIFIALSTIILAVLSGYGQNTTSTLPSKSLGLYVFPAKNQSAEQQDKDEHTCYKWAVEQTGFNPMNPPKPDTIKVQTGPDGSAIKGGAKGAAAGAAIGAIAGNTGEGAAIGAVVGGLAGIRARRKKEDESVQQQANAIDQKNQKQLDDFKKAFSACLTGKGYTIQ